MKKFFIPLGLGFVFLAGVCLVSWVSQCHTGEFPDFVFDEFSRHSRTPPWCLKDPPIMSLYYSVPGFFTSVLAAVISFGHAG